MWKISQIIGLFVLIGLSIEDFRKRSISVGVLAACLVGVVGYRWGVEPADWILTAGGICIGLFFLALSRLTGESIGYGDSMGILILGMYLGLWQMLELLSVAFAGLFLASMVCFMRRKTKKKRGIPFYPFLTLGYIVVLLGV